MPDDMADQPGDSHRLRHPRFTAHGVRRGAIEIAPVAAFVIPFGLAFGVAASAKGIAPGISIFMSIAIFAGASQFAALDLWHAPLPLATLALTVLAVNARHILLGAALAPWLLRIPIFRRFAALCLINDANFAYTMAAQDRGEMDAGVLFGSGLVMWIMWIASSAAGALAGSLLGDVSRFGFDAVMVAYFTAVIVGQFKGAADLLPWIAAATVAIAGTYLLPPGWHIVAGALAGGAVGVWRHG
ncbi:AzlC family ABC transporter permease [Rhodoplanes sp. Z2-YC6860]|uniref:AzlC family ABC transporter permease n=1 Tax=Rhodoplanes sp. Z2-YC6860 TaxID=674703 RepID=UPI001F42322E|nr:AzlC family ABC transporter permease [Rhodoplanes sp. Z2-YC6860]